MMSIHRKYIVQCLGWASTMLIHLVHFSWSTYIYSSPDQRVWAAQTCFLSEKNNVFQTLLTLDASLPLFLYSSGAPAELSHPAPRIVCTICPAVLLCSLLILPIDFFFFFILTRRRRQAGCREPETHRKRKKNHVLLGFVFFLFSPLCAFNFPHPSG